MRIISWENLIPEEIEEDEDFKDMPFKVISIPQQAHPFTNQSFQIYVGHTNFKLNKIKDASLIESVDGVETLRILSRYRFVITVGECFHFSDVSSEIESKLDCWKKTKDLTDEIIELIQEKVEKLSTNQFWAMYVFPNGQIHETVCKSYDELMEVLMFYEKCKQSSSGVVIYPPKLEIDENILSGQIKNEGN